MSSVADIPSEARCKQLVYELVTKQKHHECGQRIAWRYGRDYGWCRACRMKIRPKARTWLRGSKLRYRQLFCLLMAWQARRESWQCSSGNRTQLYYHPSVVLPAFASICRQTAANCSLAWLLSMKHGSVNSAIANAANKLLSWAA